MSASAQFPTWVFNFGLYGQLRAVRENSSIKLKNGTFEVCFFKVSMRFLIGKKVDMSVRPLTH